MAAIGFHQRVFSEPVVSSADKPSLCQVRAHLPQVVTGFLRMVGVRDDADRRESG
jgi:hypothetical protein